METDFKIYGEIFKIGKDEQVTDKFKIRPFAISTFGRYPQKIKFQLTQDRCDLIDPYRPGDKVTVHFDITGNVSSEGRIFNNLNAWRIEGEKTPVVKEFNYPEPAPQSRKAEPINVGAPDDDDLPF